MLPSETVQKLIPAGEPPPVMNHMTGKIMLDMVPGSEQLWPVELVCSDYSLR